MLIKPGMDVILHERIFQKVLNENEIENLLKVWNKLKTEDLNITVIMKFAQKSILYVSHYSIDWSQDSTNRPSEFFRRFHQITPSHKTFESLISPRD